MDMSDLSTQATRAGGARPAGDSDPATALLARQAAEVAALRARLRELEAALDLPARPGRPAPPTLPALLPRVAALERHAGLVPGLAPLPTSRPAAPAAPPAAAAPAAPPRTPWRDRGQALVVAALAIVLLAWLVHPAQPGAITPPSAAVTPMVMATSAAASVPAAPPLQGSGALAAPSPAPAVECSLTTAGSCFGQWTASGCEYDMPQDFLTMLDICFGERTSPPPLP
jgi:hypothetical protein